MFKRYIFLFCLIIYINTVFAQSVDNTLFFMEKTPQSSKFNPAKQYDYDFWIGVPALSSIYVNYSNNSFTINDLLTKKQLSPLLQDSVVFTLEKFQSSLVKNNYISVANEIEIFSMGFKAKHSYFTFGISQKSDIALSFNKNLIDFVIDGNTKYLGKTMDIGEHGLNGSIYNQLSFGYSRVFGHDKDFTVGARLNIIMGVANIRTVQSDISAYTDVDGMSVKVLANQKLYASLPVDMQRMIGSNGYVDFDSVSLNDTLLDTRFFTGIDNLGWGLDIGVQYKPNSDFSVYASLVDVGFIKWKSNLVEFKQGHYNGNNAEPVSFEWQGSDWGQYDKGDDADFKDFKVTMNNLMDSLSYKFNLNEKEVAYNTYLNSKLYLGLDYKVSSNVNLGVLSKTQYYYGNVSTSLTLSANVDINNNIGTYISYTAVNNSFNNVGVGISAKLGCMQFYMVTDNILASYITNTQVGNFRFGINFIFNAKKNKR